jgi:D-alanine--poly(phosphoribitol) ligase subunit 1
MKETAYIYNLGQLFSKVALENKSRVAIKSVQEETFSYDELEKKSNQIAYLLSNFGIKKTDVIAILNNKTFTSYALMIACLKLGVIYTNLDPRSPFERFKRMLDVCNPKLLLYSGFDNNSIINELEGIALEKIDYSSKHFQDDLASMPDLQDKSNQFVTSNNPAYIMFTSGSTGFPKGVVISHGNVMNFINWARTTYDISANDVFTNLNPMHFDNSVFDFYASLFIGALLLPIKEELTINPRKLLDALNRLKPTIWFSVPSMLVYVLNMRALKSDDLHSLRIVTFGGEGFPKNKLRELWNKWGQRVRFVNVYGPTECTCICSSYEVTKEDMHNDELLPLGPIAPNFSAIVVDDNNLSVKDDVIGELYIGGPNVGIGYYNNLSKTQEVFVNNPNFTTHKEIVYKSGDLVSFDSKLNVFYFKGRKDNQIKRMGYRIELEEIENALNAIDFVQESAVIFVDNPNYQSKIIACLKSSENDKGRITSYLSKHLPIYMMPDMIEFYEQLPKNQNGKIDRLNLKSNYKL